MTGTASYVKVCRVLHEAQALRKETGIRSMVLSGASMGFDINVAGRLVLYSTPLSLAYLGFSNPNRDWLPSWLFGVTSPNLHQPVNAPFL